VKEQVMDVIALRKRTALDLVSEFLEVEVSDRREVLAIPADALRQGDVLQYGGREWKVMMAAPMQQGDTLIVARSKVFVAPFLMDLFELAPVVRLAPRSAGRVE
jgi:hypothetical protein